MLVAGLSEILDNTCLNDCIHLSHDFIKGCQHQLIIGICKMLFLSFQQPINSVILKKDLLEMDELEDENFFSHE